ncbi:hypothetical protein [Sphingomonas sp. DBB INV C78]|uniref:hypothetical protein n=1 Tax=Sphingomonas sp. DBB INV C78 TaxID=3349434 RepID=UPI0036D2FB3A
MIVAPLKAGAADPVRALLATMVKQPGFADPQNPLIPFVRFETIHVARLLVLDDPTLGDRDAYPDNAIDVGPSLALLGYCDGSADKLLDRLAAEAETGLRAIFTHCEGFDGAADLRGWMARHRIRPAIAYINWVGRTVHQVREEAALHAMLQQEIGDMPVAPPQAVASELRDAVRRRAPTLTRAPHTPIGWRVRNFLHLLSLPVAVLLLWPLLLLATPFIAIKLRRREKRDPIRCPRPTPDRLAMLSRYEDHDVTNPFSAIGSIKPGRFRRWLTIVILWAINWTTHHIYTRGRLARVGTIHFARWVFLDDKSRLFFASNYDGSLEAYMDDFINKVAFGLNLVFSNGIGYPKTDWLIIGGARREQDFKAFLRHHQMPTDVWYKAYPGLTTHDLARNSRLRDGFEQGFADADAARRWLAEI